MNNRGWQSNKSRAGTGVYPFHMRPEMAPDESQGVGESGFRLFVPGSGAQRERTVLREALGEKRVTVIGGESQSAPAHGDLPWERTAGGWSAPLDHDSDRVALVVTQLANSGSSFTIAPPTLADVFEHHTGAQLDIDDAAAEGQRSE